ncbi:MAG: hypothetical protein R3186_07220 [Ruegeria sp.]|nr:hypothetical protein [Ruegeria sp.]
MFVAESTYRLMVTPDRFEIAHFGLGPVVVVVRSGFVLRLGFRAIDTWRTIEPMHLVFAVVQKAWRFGAYDYKTARYVRVGNNGRGAKLGGKDRYYILQVNEAQTGH